MRFRCPLLERTQETPSCHFAGQAELGEHPTRALENSDGHSRAFCKCLAGCCDAPACPQVGKRGHTHRDGKDPFGVGVMVSAKPFSFFPIETFADLALPLCAS